MTDVRQIYTYIYIYKWKISIDITCVGLASARPNYSCHYIPAVRPTDEVITPCACAIGKVSIVVVSTKIARYGDLGI